MTEQWAVPPETINAMRDWAEDCAWLDEDLIDEMSDYQIMCGVERHYEGGIYGFIRDLERSGL